MHKHLRSPTLTSFNLPQVFFLKFCALDIFPPSILHSLNVYDILQRRGHYKGVNEIIVFEKDDGHYDVRLAPPFPKI